ncbi:pyrroline-5-carboxylate reductase [Taklimakanibacter lacteus]|uniref:pyrroline-5-carboxylate reductase n=1 Tax=Taklimakanibacter lacteus TaxID=2268456 RepID=UPI000E66BC18
MTISLKGTLVLVGAGKMGGAMLEGWLKSGVKASQVVALDPSPPPEILALLQKHAIRHNPAVATIKDAEVVLIAVKPQVMEDVLPGIAGLKASRPLVLSVAAGKTIASFARHFGADAAIIRTIPNTPAAIGRGITAMAANAHASPAQIALATALLSAIGEVVTVSDEALIDAVTAVSGSGPAYVFYLTECLAEAGVAQGLPPDIAMQLARATVAGAGELMRVTGQPAATLRQNVTSPKGTTYAALQVLMADDGLDPLMKKAIDAATRRSRELAS